MIFWLDRVFRWIRMTFQAVRNVRNRWAPELKQLSDNIEKLEESLAGTDDCMVDIFSLEEKLDDRMTVLEEKLTSAKADITYLKDHLNSVIKELNVITDGGIENKLDFMEEELDAVKAENVEMRNHLNSLIKELNVITTFMNEKHGRNVVTQIFENTRSQKRKRDERNKMMEQDGDDAGKEGPREYPDAEGNPIKIVNYELF